MYLMYVMAWSAMVWYVYSIAFPWYSHGLHVVDVAGAGLGDFPEDLRAQASNADVVGGSAGLGGGVARCSVGGGLKQPRGGCPVRDLTWRMFTSSPVIIWLN